MKICILDAITLGKDVDLSVFKKFGGLTIYQTTRPEETAARIKGQDIVVTNKVVLDEKIISNAPSLKMICVTATGANNVDLACARARGIAVANVSGYSTDSVVQHTFALLFYLLNHMRYHDDYVKSGSYMKSPLFTHLDRPYMELKGKTWGIIGMGNIGKAVAGIAKAFGCNVIYFSTSGRNTAAGHRRTDLETLLKESDIVSIHAPLNQSTKNLLDASRLALMKKTAILINVGRGGIVNEEALVEQIEKDAIGGAALDVLEKEPMVKNSPLLRVIDSHKIVVTPHIAWASVESRNRLVREIVLNIEAFLKGESRNRVD